MRPPFITVETRKRDGARDLDDLTRDVLTRCFKSDLLKYVRLCTAARLLGIPVTAYVRIQISELLATTIKTAPKTVQELRS